MNNGSNNSSNFKFQSSQKVREIENQLEREISGIINKQKAFTNSSNRFSGYSGMSENVSSKLKSFLDERLAKKGLGEKGFNEQAYEQSLDYQIDSNYNSQHHQSNDDYDEQNDYYDEEDNYYEDDYEDEDYEELIAEKGNNSNPNTYLPFTYEELQPEMPSTEEIENMVLDNMMPAIAQWLDLNIDRIVHKVVKESLSNRGQPERYSERYVNRSVAPRESNEYSTRYTRVEREQPQPRKRISDSIKSIEKGSTRGMNLSSRNLSSKDGAVARNSSVKKTSTTKIVARGGVSGVSKSSTSKNSRNSTNNRNTTKR